MAPPRKHQPVDKVCPQCQKTFRCTTGYAITSQVYCGLKCFAVVNGNGRKGQVVSKPCLGCGNIMRVKLALADVRKTCSYACREIYFAREGVHRGENNGAWAGGTAAFWKQKARERDDFTCRFPGCGKRDTGKGTHAHHVIPRNVGGSDDLSNLATLCKYHHMAVEREVFKRLIEQFPQAAAEAFRDITRPLLSIQIILDDGRRAEVVQTIGPISG